MNNIKGDEEEFEPPKYSDPGRALFRVYKDEPLWGKRSLYFEAYDYDDNGATFWVAEGVGIEYWLEEWFELDMVEAEGWFVVEDVTGAAGTSYHYEYGPEGWEEFYPGNVRYATAQEIKSQSLTRS